METETILAELDAEIARLRQAKEILTVLSGEPVKAKRGRPVASVVSPKKKKRNLFPEGRARIAAAVKARWARQKKGS